MNLRPVLREPLVHFLLLGVLLFGFVQWRAGPAGAGADRIRVTPAQIETLAALFTRTWQRPPTDEELKGLVDEYVRDELAYREAVAMGLDRDDQVIRSRLRQKLEFLIEDPMDAAPPTDSALQAWLDAHADEYGTEPAVAFRQVFISIDRRGTDAARAQAESLRRRLDGAGPDAPADALGDATMLPHAVPLSSRHAVAAQFGDAFADAVLDLRPGAWSAPIASGYGLHLVQVRERRDGPLPALADIRPQLERDVLLAERRERIRRLYEQLLTRYRVDLDFGDTNP